MTPYSIINLKTDPELKKRAVKTAAKLGISISAVLNNELRRFATEESVSFEIPEIPNAATARELEQSKKSIDNNENYIFENTDQALSFLADALE